ncbi:hypothetical protein HD806DRAFT_548470 [Xylariaceae sp. AK1471]|nr:hypothetical protein HD806DRAFT_548470 [Xylariaceae sp. AK1471]
MMQAQPVARGQRLAMPSSSCNYPISNRGMPHDLSQMNGEFMLAPGQYPLSFELTLAEEAPSQGDIPKQFQESGRTFLSNPCSEATNEPHTPVVTIGACQDSRTSYNTNNYTNQETANQCVSLELDIPVGARDPTPKVATVVELSSCSKETSSPSVAGQSTQTTASQHLPLPIEKATVFPVPGSRSKKNIYLDLIVSMPSWSTEECQERGRFVIVELKRAVDGHRDLRLRAGFIHYSLRMVGKSPEAAEPSIIIKCMYQDAAGLRSLFKHSTRILGCIISMPYTAHLFAHPPDSNRLSSWFTFPQTYRASVTQLVKLTATIGLSLSIGRQLGLLTVGHLFSDYSEDTGGAKAPYLRQYSPSPTVSTSANHNLPWIDDDDQDFSQEPCQTYLPTAARGSPEPQQDRDNAQDGEQENPLIHIGLPTGNRLNPTGRLSPNVQALDFAIVTLEADIMSSRKANMIYPHDPSSSPIFLDTVAEHPRTHGARVFIVSGTSGLYSGTLLDGFEYLGSGPSRKMCEVWAVIPDYPAEVMDGDCGSVVVDQETFEIYGHVIGSDCFGNAHVVPLINTMRQIKTLFGVNYVALTPPVTNNNSVHGKTTS